MRPPNGDQAARLVARYYGEALAVGEPLPFGLARLSGIAPAEVVEVCKRHDTSEAACAELLGRMRIAA